MEKSSCFHLFIFYSLYSLGLILRVQAASANVSVSFQQRFSVIWGSPRIVEDEGKAELTLGKQSGSGFMSLEGYCYGVFSASIKLPRDYTAGVVVAFYMSNADSFPNNHDELDFEFLGNIHGKRWRMQTNIYGNGSVERGREERFDFWFDPSQDFHDYSIVWNHKHIVFTVDSIPIREMIRKEGLGGDYPSKPMALYATIWDGSGWATEGGKHPVDYRYAPFVAAFQDMRMEGCATDAMESLQHKCSAMMEDEVDQKNPLHMAYNVGQLVEEGGSMEWVRNNHMYYSYYDDRNRYPQPLPECKTAPTSTRRRKKKAASYASHHRHPKHSPKEKAVILLP